MLHLFNKIYVLPDANIDHKVDRIIISENFASEIANIERIYTELGTDAGEVIANVNSIGELVGEGKTFPTYGAMFQDLVSREKVKIFADVDAIAHIHSAYMKTIFGNITVDTAFILYNAVAQKIKMTMPTTISSKGFTSERKNALVGVTHKTKDQYTEIFNSITPWADSVDRKSFVTKQKDNISLEWHLATYFNDANHISSFKDKYVYLATKLASYEVYEWYEYIVGNIMTPEVQKVLGVSIDWTNNDWRQTLKDNATLGWLFDDEFKAVSYDVNYLKENAAKAEVLGNLFEQICKEQGDDKVVEYSYVKFARNIISNVLKKGEYTDDDVKALIQEEYDSAIPSSMMHCFMHTTKFNSYLMQYIYQLKKNSDSKLAELNINV